MLRLQRLVDGLVELLVASRRLRSVQIAPASNVAIWGVEVQRVRNDVEIRE